MPSTFAHALFPSTCLWLSKGGFPRLNRTQWLKLLALGIFLANSPDLDLIPASLFPDQWNPIHRSWGHNIFSVTLLIWLGSHLQRRFVSKENSSRQAWLVSAALVLSHLMLDAMMDTTPDGKLHGIPILFPFSDLQVRLPWRVFPTVITREGVHPFLGHVLSPTFWQSVIFREIFVSLALAFLWGGVLCSFRWLARLKDRKKSKAPASSR